MQTLRAASVKALLLLFLLPAGTINSETASSPVISVLIGYGGVVRAAEWMPVDVELRANGYRGAGVLEVQVDDSSQGYLNRQNFTSQPNPFGPTYTTAYDIPVQLSSDSNVHVRTYVVSDLQNPAVSVRFLSAGRQVAGSVKAQAQTTRLLIGVIAHQMSPYDTLSSVRFPNGVNARVVALSAQSLPSSAVLLRAFDLLVLDDFPTENLSREQKTALAEHVAAGGSLFVAMGDTSLKTLGGLPASLVATGPGVNWLEDRGKPIISESRVGGGIVELARVSLTSPAFAASGETPAILRQVVIRSTLQRPQSDAAPASVMPGQGPIWGPLGFQGSITKRSWFLMPDLGNQPNIVVPPASLLGLLAAGYVIVVAGTFLLLRRIRRTAWFWVIVPAVAAISVLALWATASGMPNVPVNQFSVTYATPGTATAYRETFTALRPSRGGDYRATVSGAPLIAPFAVGYGSNRDIGTGIRISPQPSSVSLLRMSGSSVRGYATEEMLTAPTLHAQLSLLNGRMKGKLENASSMRLSDAVVLAGGSIIHLGELLPGRTVSIDAPLVTSTSPLNGTLTSLQIYPNSLGGPPPAAPLSGDQRISLLQLMLGEYDTPSAQLAPLLLAWLPGPVEPLTLDHGQAQIRSQNAIVMPLSIANITGSLPAGFITPRLVDAGGKTDLSQQGTTVANASVTYEFTLPLPAGTTTNGLAIRHAMRPGPFLTGGLTGSGGQVLARSDVWDWSSSTWVSIALGDNVAASLPAGALQPGTGLLRLRIQSVNGSTFQVGSLWLEGSVAPRQ